VNFNPPRFFCIGAATPHTPVTIFFLFLACIHAVDGMTTGLVPLARSGLMKSPIALVFFLVGSESPFSCVHHKFCGRFLVVRSPEATRVFSHLRRSFSWVLTPLFVFPPRVFLSNRVLFPPPGTRIVLLPWVLPFFHSPTLVY